MFLPHWTKFVAAATVCGIAFGATQTLALPTNRSVPVTVVSLENRVPVGHLGVPLGTVVRVTGEGYDGPVTRKGDAGKTLIRIVTVNGAKLASPVVFEFLRAPDSVKKPAAREKFDYFVHEYGAFDGVVEPPEETGLQKSGLAHDGFHYRPGLTIHASNKR
jgi:hypothetical protein